MEFRYHDQILEAFPNLCGGVILASNVHNGPTPPDLQSVYQQEQATTLERITEPLSDLPSLAAWRQAFRTFGVNPTKSRSAAEALLRRLTKKGDIPSINTLVDQKIQLRTTYLVIVLKAVMRLIQEFTKLGKFSGA